MIILKICLLNLMECEMKLNEWPTFENARFVIIYIFRMF